MSLELLIRFTHSHACHQFLLFDTWTSLLYAAQWGGSKTVSKWYDPHRQIVERPNSMKATFTPYVFHKLFSFFQTLRF